MIILAEKVNNNNPTGNLPRNYLSMYNMTYNNDCIEDLEAIIKLLNYMCLICGFPESIQILSIDNKITSILVNGKEVDNVRLVVACRQFDLHV